MSRKSSSREEILDAAERVVTQSGAAHLTLDAVAEGAQISKGGLLHHFPSKEALLRAMLSRHLQRVDAEQQAQAAGSDQPGPGAGLRAFIRSGFRERDDSQPVCAALLAAGATDPKLLSPVREWHERHFKEYAAPARYPLRVMVLLLAMDGLWLNELLGTLPLEGASKQELLQAMLELADQVV